MHKLTTEQFGNLYRALNDIDYEGAMLMRWSTSARVSILHGEDIAAETYLTALKDSFTKAVAAIDAIQRATTPASVQDVSHETTGVAA